MMKKKKHRANSPDPAHADRSKNYNLKSSAVDTLANAEQGQVPEYSREELERYRSKKGIQVPEAAKVLFAKAWFAGAVCFFFFWGLGTYIGSMLDMLFILGVALGIVTDLLTNPVIRFIEPTNGANEKWVMWSGKGVVSLFCNILYAFVVITCVYLFYHLINTGLTAVFGGDTVLGVEPILFGVFCMGFDVLFLSVKHILRDMLHRKGSPKTVGHK